MTIMRVLEILLMGFLILFSLRLLLPTSRGAFDRKKTFGWISILGIIILFLQLVVEGYRWQMLPIYIPLALFLVHGVNLLRSFYNTTQEPATTSRKRGITLVIIALILCVATIQIDIFLPMFQVPTPTGEYEIGTTHFELTDLSRNETFTTTPDDHRRFSIRTWYPTDDITGLQLAPYVDYPAEFGKGVAQSWGFPSFIVSHFSSIPTHSYYNAPLSEDGDFPIIMFSHGYGGFDIQDTSLMQELASHGYIVFSLAHSYEAATTYFPNGDAIYSADIVVPYDSTLNDSLKIWADDTIFLLDQLEITENSLIPSVFHTGLDFTRVGAIGHSFGGSTAEEVCLIDARFLAGISLDSPHILHSLDMSMTKPFLMMFSEAYGDPEMNDIVYQNSVADCYGLFVNGTKHHNFADTSIWSPLLKSFGTIGTIDGYRMLHILNDYVLEFFDEYLKGEASVLLDGPPSSYPEVIFYSKS